MAQTAQQWHRSTAAANINTVTTNLLQIIGVAYAQHHKSMQHKARYTWNRKGKATIENETWVRERTINECGTMTLQQEYDKKNNEIRWA